MKLDKAIEEQTMFIQLISEGTDPRFIDALKLLIEAGKREMEYRESMPVKKGELLPGETKD